MQRFINFCAFLLVAIFRCCCRRRRRRGHRQPFTWSAYGHETHFYIRSLCLSCYFIFLFSSLLFFDLFWFFVLFLVDILWAMLNRAHVGFFPFYVCYIIGHIFSVYMCTYRYRYFLCEKEINFVFILSMLNLRAFFVICTRRRPLFPFDIELTRLFSLWAAFFSSCVLILL